MVKELDAVELRRVVDATTVGCAASGEVKPLEGIIGQPRAIQALHLGLEIRDPTFHIYVAGPPGTGRTTAVRTFLEKLARQRERPSDWCYLNNFQDPYRPHACRLPPGQGRAFQRDMADLIQRARAEIPKAFESEAYTERRNKIGEGLVERRNELLEGVTEGGRQAGFLLRPTPAGLLIIPMVDDKPLKEEDFHALPKERQDEIRKKREELEERVHEVLKEIRALERDAVAKVEELDREVALFVVGGLVEDLVEKYDVHDEIKKYLEEVQEDIVENLDAFRKTGEEETPKLPFKVPGADEAAFRRYQVNVVVDHDEREGAPVVTELNPSYHNLFGRILKEQEFGAVSTDFTLIKPGSLHHANGGFLVLPVEEVLRNLFVWESLKRALVNRHIQIEELSERLGYTTTQTLRPEPIPLDVKVVLIGTTALYQLLLELDEDFSELFKVKAHFDDQMGRSEKNVDDFVAFLCTLCVKEGLPPLDRHAAARVVEHASRMADDQLKLSTRFARVADLVRESAHYARKADSSYVRAKDVQEAIDAELYRANLVEERLREMVTRGAMRIDTSGAAVGQVNGLSVLSTGDHEFGRPSRITASLSLGREGIVDIERQVKLGGPIHSKGVMILSGYLASRFARDYPLTLSARLVFEQSYGGVDGDSASSTELYALLSSLADLPLRQDVAVTGSVDQQGNIQPVGGVNQKIEGFFDLCKERGLTGTQGVLMPPQNVENLMLRADVVDAVREGRFHVWTAQTVDEGVAHLTGKPAGRPGADGRYPKDSVNGRVDRRLREMAERLKDFAAPTLPPKADAQP
jgi:lon-related putative ATP-dependent protease